MAVDDDFAELDPEEDSEGEEEAEPLEAELEPGLEPETELEPELEPEPEPVRFAEYELDRLRTMVANARWLLGTAQAELRNASAFSSHTHRAFLQQELRKAESLMETAQLEYERAAAQCM